MAMVPRKLKYVVLTLAFIAMYPFCSLVLRDDNWIPDDAKEQLEDMEKEMQNFQDRRALYAINQTQNKENIQKKMKQEPRQLNQGDDDKDIVNGRLVTSNGVPVKVILLVGSTARSGTSFTGELLSMQNNSIYLFEPTHFISYTTKERVTEDEGMSHILDVIHCRLRNRYVLWLQRYSYSPKKARTPRISDSDGKIDWRKRLTAPFLTSVCREKPIRIIKVIRVRMAWVRVLLDDPQLDVKIIHLVRDPRASLFSIAKNGLNKLDPYFHCPRIKDDLVVTPQLIAEFPGKVMEMTYEKFCIDVFDKATKIWRFLTSDNQASLPLQWSQYLEEHTHAQKKDVKPFLTARNTTHEYQAWRWEIKKEAFYLIEKECKPVLNMLQYTIFGSRQRLRDATVPLFVRPPRW